MEVTVYHRETNNETIERFVELVLDENLKFFASELLRYGFKDMAGVERAVERAIHVCKASLIPIRGNFKSLVLSDAGIVIHDWKLSPLARKLVLLNGDATNPYVAKAQIGLLEALQF